jgi:hypothetical protein
MVPIALPLALPHTPLTPALALAVRLAVAQYPTEAAQIQRGHAIVRQGGVRLSGSGLAEVQSQHQPATWYVVNGGCGCPNSRYAPQGHCKHWWAKRLLVWAQTAYAQTTTRRIPAAPGTPYAFPRWSRYAATYQGPQTGMQPVNGMAELLEPGWFFFQPIAGEDGWECAYHEVALGPGLEADPDMLAGPGDGAASPADREADRRALPGQQGCPGDVVSGLTDERPHAAATAACTHSAHDK